MTLTAGTRLGRYEILAPLGKGGMGEVYRARDTQLGRDVAIKVLPPHLAQDAVALKRFEREARTVAALSHPNILSIHDSGTDRGIGYAVMELLQGQTLRDRMYSGKIPFRKSVAIAAAIADGLTAAHGQGIIHRDLKPDNVFLTQDRRVKILDFGLARTVEGASQDLTEAPTKSQVTELGSVIGTIPYMSPEQVRGESLDARSDIFSFGSLLYEMFSGKRPFSGNSAAETTAAILKDEAPRLSDIPPELQRIVERCMEKDPSRRFHSAHDLAFALRDVSLISGQTSGHIPAASNSTRRLWIPAIFLVVLAVLIGWKWFASRKSKPNNLQMPKIESLAVLPLKNLSADSKQEYFADGMTEELIAKIARISSIRVISRTSVMEYKNPQKPLPEIAKELNVDAIVEGSVLHAGNRVRITVQLIHAATDRHLWAESYEKNLVDILTLQNDVASAIAREIQAKVEPDEAAHLKSAPKVNPEAYQAYLRGVNYAEDEITNENLRLAVEMFQRAVDLDPSFAKAYAELSRAQGFLYFGVDKSPEWLKKSKAALDRAFELQPGIPEGHIALGYYYYRGFRDYDRALQELRIAQKILPNNKAILAGESTIYRRQGKFQDAIDAEEKLVSLNPRDSTVRCDLGITYGFVRNYEKAQESYDRCIALSPDNNTGYTLGSRNLIVWKGDVKGAREYLNQAPKKTDFEVGQAQVMLELYERDYDGALKLLANLVTEQRLRALVLQGMVHLYNKDKKSAEASLTTAVTELQKVLKQNPNQPYYRAILGLAYAGLGRKNDALREAKAAVEFLPVSKDAMWGPTMLEYLAFVYVLNGDHNAAIDQLEYLLSIPSELSTPVLRIEPRWDPLRGNPRFEKLLNSSN